MLILLGLERPSPAAAHWQTPACGLLRDMRCVVIPLLLSLAGCNAAGHSSSSQDNETIVQRDADALQKSTNQNIKGQVDTIGAETPSASATPPANVPPTPQPADASAAQTK